MYTYDCVQFERDIYTKEKVLQKLLTIVKELCGS